MTYPFAMPKEQKIARLRLVADGLRRIQEFESAAYLDEYAALLSTTPEPQE